MTRTQLEKENKKFYAKQQTICGPPIRTPLLPLIHSKKKREKKLEEDGIHTYSKFCQEAEEGKLVCRERLLGENVTSPT